MSIDRKGSLKSFFKFGKSQDKQEEDKQDGGFINVTIEEEKKVERPVADGSVSEVQLRVSCRDLLDLDWFSKSDPMCVLFIQSRTSPDWQELGRTEHVQNNLNPDFEKLFVLDYFPNEHQMLKFEIFDVDNELADLAEHDFIGNMVWSLGSILDSIRASGGKIEHKLENPKHTKKSPGRIIISVVEIAKPQPVVEAKAPEADAYDMLAQISDIDIPDIDFAINDGKKKRELVDDNDEVVMVTESHQVESAMDDEQFISQFDEPEVSPEEKVEDDGLVRVQTPHGVLLFNTKSNNEVDEHHKGSCKVKGCDLGDCSWQDPAPRKIIPLQTICVCSQRCEADGSFICHLNIAQVQVAADDEDAPMKGGFVGSEITLKFNEGNSNVSVHGGTEQQAVMLSA